MSFNGRQQDEKGGEKRKVCRDGVLHDE
jgi:hypothetical protein